MIICLYVDDMLILGTSLDLMNEVKEFLSTKFEMQDVCEADLILGVKFFRSLHVFRVRSIMLRRYL